MTAYRIEFSGKSQQNIEVEYKIGEYGYISSEKRER
jgi:hypothetical protein